METPLWIDAHAPDIEDFPQAAVREYLDRAAGGPINLLLYGPPGSGKTAAVRALARRVHADPGADLVEINVADFFGRTKREIRDDPRFEAFLQGEIPWVKQVGRDRKQSFSKRYKSDWSKAEMINHVIKEFAAMRPASGGYKTLLLDNAEAIREDFQQALRRVMERHYRTTQFVIATRQPSKLIPPITSRCFPIPVRRPTNDEIVDVLTTIVEAEAVPYEGTGLRDIASHADGNLRTAILDAQAVAEEAGEITREATYEVLREVGYDDRIEGMLTLAAAGEFTDARSELDDLLVTEGLSGDEVLSEVVRIARARDLADDAALARLAGEIEFDLATGTNDRLHLSHLLAELGAG